MKKYQILCCVLTICCMCIIFGFSAQPSDDSGEVSGVIGMKIVSTANKLFSWHMGSEKMQELALKLDKPIRKTAHAVEYGILAICMFFWFDCFYWPMRKHILVTIAIGAMYAASDEIHQRFVPGRYGCLTDVLIDSLGVVLGLLFVIGVGKCTNSLWKKNKSAETELSSEARM